MKRGVTSLVIVLALVISVASVVNLVNFKETPVAGEIGLSPYGYNPYASGGYNPSAPIGPTSCDSDVDCDEGEFCSPIDPNNRFCLPESLVIHYDFEDLGLGPSSSGLVDNIAGSSYDGNLIGGMFSNPSGGVQGDYLKLSGTNEHVDIPYQLDYGRSFSISVWARPDTLDMNQWERNIITDRPGGRPWVDIFLSKRNRFGFFLWDDPVDARSASTIQGGSARVNEWSHIVGVYEVTGAIDSNSWNVDTTLYVNGEKINTKSTSVTEGGLSNLNIGRGVTNQRFFDGGIDEVKIFNYPLDGEEVQDLFGREIGLVIVEDDSRIVENPEVLEDLGDFLDSEGYNYENKLNSEVVISDLIGSADIGKITVLIYKDDAVIIIDNRGPSSSFLLATSIEAFLSDYIVDNLCIVGSNEVTDDNLVYAISLCET